MVKTGIIYKATCIKNEKVYIGQTTQILNKRKNNHIYHAFNKDSPLYSIHFYNAIRKYGKDNFKWEMIYENIPINYLNIMEIWIISIYNSYKKGYNGTKGGEATRGHKHSEETKEKMSLTRKGKKHSEETKEKMSLAQKGKKHSEETKEKISQSNKGHKCIEETKRKMSKSQKGRKHSKETKEKMSESGKRRFVNGEHPWCNKHHTKETKEKMSKSQKKRFVDGEHPWRNKHHTKETIRKVSGENSCRAKLNWGKVENIRELYATGNYSMELLSNKYKVARSTIYCVIHNITWKK